MVEEIIKEANFVNSQIPTRIRDYKVWFYTDKSICRIESIGAGFGLSGGKKGDSFTIDSVVKRLSV